MTARYPASIVIALAPILLAACTQTTTPKSSKQAAHTSPQDALTPIVLPELSGLAESVQRQIRERKRELDQTLARPGASRAEQAAAYGALGRLLMAAKFSDAAATCFSHAESLAPDDMRWAYYSGHAALRSGDRARAAEGFERALKIHPNDQAALVWLGESYLDDDRLDLAQSAFQRALAIKPQSAPALFAAGRTALARREFVEATQYLERALAADARASAIHYPLAMAYRGLGDTQKAEAHLRQRGGSYPVLEDPLMQDDEELLESAVSFESRGMAALKTADFAGAIGAFRKGLELAPNDTSLRYWLGAALYASGDADGALRELSDVVRRDPDHAKAHFSLGAIDDARGQRAKAIAEYQAAVHADPNLPDSRLRLAEDLRASGRLAASVEQYDAAVRLDPTMVDAWIGGAHALIGLKQTDKASDWLARARRLFPNRSEFPEMQPRQKANP
jgi:tetratricopeptide (TPR) repeat protein